MLIFLADQHQYTFPLCIVLSNIDTLYCGCQGYWKDCACSQKINKAEIFDELEADNPGLDITVDDVGDNKQVGEHTDEDDDADEEDLDVVGDEMNAGGIAGWQEVWNKTNVVT